MMRWTVLLAVVGVVGCAQSGDQGEVFDPLATGDDWSEPAEQYYARFGGTFTPADEGTLSDGEAPDDGYEGTANGTEYVTITDAQGVLQCDWVWDTTGLTVKGDGAACEDCDQTWDVTCFDGHEARGDCSGWIDPDANEGPMEFQLAFSPEWVDDAGIEHGTVYSRASEVDAWRPYAEGTWDGATVSYELEYEWY